MVEIEPRKRIDGIAVKLKAETRIKPFESGEWKKDVPKKADVYVLWENSGKRKPVYIGETCNLHERFTDLGSWRNHTFTRQIKKKYRLSKPASIRDRISFLFEVSYIQTSFGRSEIEEYLVYKWETFEMFNKPLSRFCRSQAIKMERE